MPVCSRSATSKPVHHTGRRCCSSTAGPTTATQRPFAELAFSEPSGAPGWKDLPSWAVIATGDKAAGTDVVRSMAERAGADIVGVEGSHVIMVSQPQAVTDQILKAASSAVPA
jgi:Alpha/beta hydrolase family